MRVFPFAALLGAIALGMSGCGGGGKKAAPPPRWVQRANSVCKADDPKAEEGAFDSMAMIVGLRREANDLARIGFFKRVPAAAVDVEIAGRLLFSAHSDEFGVLRRADKYLIRARRTAARNGVHCSFAVYPLRNL